MMQILLATHNRDKLKEIGLALEGLPIDLVSLLDFPGVSATVEDGATLEANALKKAREAHRATGLAAIADDTGLEVAALGGAPGVFSARYAGPNATYEDNCRKLLREMEWKTERSALFRCVIVLVGLPLSLTLPPRREGIPKFPLSPGRRDGSLIPLSPLGRGEGEGEVFEGRCEGRIATAPRGTNGFGYDPVFEVPGLGKTFAELSPEDKNRVSHRGRALRKLAMSLRGSASGGDEAIPR